MPDTERLTQSVEEAAADQPTAQKKEHYNRLMPDPVKNASA